MGFLSAVIAAAFRFAVLVIDDPDDSRLVTDLSVAAAALGVTPFAVGIVCGAWSRADGEGPWLDPFADVGTGADPEGEAENARYIAEYGKWTVFDADEGSAVSALIGHSVEALTVDTVADGKPVTAVFDLGDRSLVLAAMGDELVTIVRKR